MVLEALLIGLVTSQISFIVTTVYLHRALAHKAITLRPSVAFACRVVIWMSTGTRPRQWVAVHRKHHAHTDKEGDPHSPVIFGYSLVQFGNAVLYRRVSKNREQVVRYAKDLPEDRWDKVLFNHALLGLALGIALLIAVFGWEIGLIAGAVHASIYLLGGGAINGIGHKWGKRPHDNLATNNQWLAWLVAGEGLHNNHHAVTTSSRPPSRSSAAVAVCCAKALAVAGSRAMDAARAAWAAAPSTSSRAPARRPRATTKSSITMSSGVSSTSSVATAPDSPSPHRRSRSDRFDRQGEDPDDALGVSGHRDRGCRGSTGRGDVGIGEHAWPELVENAFGFGLAGPGRLALETADRYALLGYGRSDVLGVLP